jgi:hypothetical protein
MRNLALFLIAPFIATASGMYPIAPWTALGCLVVAALLAAALIFHREARHG